MRKYHQAALTLTAAFSLIALMFYRHEYNKLRFVLQVFNYFGKPMKNGYYYDNCTSNMPISMRLNSDYSEPISSWQRLSDNFYVYSSYRVNDYEIKTIAFGEDTDIINYSCKIYIDDDDDNNGGGNYNNENNNNNNIVSVPGDFSYVVMDSTHQPQSTNDVYEGDKTYSGFILTCKCQMAIDNDKQVIGVEYSSSPSTATNNDEYIYQSVHTIIDDNNNNNNKSAMAICITPYNSNSNNLPKRMDMISYLSFNHYIGLNNFIIYNSDIISHVFNNGLKALAALTSNSNNSFTYTTVTWNFPYKNMPSFILRKIIETDCIYRSYNKAAFSMTFEWNEYLNLNHHSSFLNLLSNIDKSVFFGTTEAADTTILGNNKNIDRYEINVVTYCTDMASHDSFNNTTPIILRATRRLVNNKFTQQRFVYKLINNINNIADNKLITKDNMNDFVVINKYEKCFIDDKNKNQLFENGLLKFAEFMTNSQIFQYYISGKLFY
ncbi:putative uncharacterized protein DDB_G0282133 [Aphidius gifuensis]|uniref:putative uncharacterized protein DDB_G0282133 n=1 Tax=Aphidius gifuensis TaxID=684658 RepID=UPI001CDB58DD|nr:putative uncharacterized protein DDB_G0282133 [Aphidius gifuensis]